MYSKGSVDTYSHPAVTGGVRLTLSFCLLLSLCVSLFLCLALSPLRRQCVVEGQRSLVKSLWFVRRSYLGLREQFFSACALGGCLGWPASFFEGQDGQAKGRAREDA